MKKYSIIGIVGSMLMIVILGFCMMREKQTKMTPFANATVVYEWSEKQIEDTLKIDMDWLNEYEVYSSLAKLDYETIMVFAVKEAKQGQVKKQLAKYVEALKATHPQQLDEINRDTKMYEHKQKLVLVISENVQEIIKQSKER